MQIRPFNGFFFFIRQCFPSSFHENLIKGSFKFFI